MEVHHFGAARVPRVTDPQYPATPVYLGLAHVMTIAMSPSPSGKHLFRRSMPYVRSVRQNQQWSVRSKIWKVSPVGYTTAPWVGFGEALAAVAGALTGLLFVALSVKGDVVAASRSLSSRAAETLVLFMISVLVAVLLVAPQPAAALGSELLAVAVVSGAALLILDRRAGHGSDQVVARFIERFSPNTITAVLVGVAGITFLVKAGGGLYWLIPAAVASLVGGVVNAWLFLVRVTG